MSHLLAAKRSLSSINHVYRANELVTNTRVALEAHAITAARTTFLRNGISVQVELLDQVRAHTGSVARESAAEFSTALEDLDSVGVRLRETLDVLGRTIVHRNLKPDQDEQRSLLDFVDQMGVDGVMGTIRESIDTIGVARKDFEESNAALEEDINGVKGLLDSQKRGMSVGDIRKGWRSPVPEILHSMEENAKDSADNLESLVKHFDLCVTAIKHTEGGGAVAERIADELPEGVGMELGKEDAHPEPMSEEERQEMMEILEKDASEVEEVVIETRDRAMDMEAQFEHVNAYTDQLEDDYATKVAAFRLLEEVGERLPGYITQSQLFLLRWDEEKAKIEERMEELESLRSFYEGFVRAYDNLIVEVHRRKTMEVKMEKVVQDARYKLEKLYKEDAAERKAFKQEQGDFLPVDIWPGLMNEPMRYEIAPSSEAAEKVPDISKSIVQQAIRRVSGKG